MSDTLDPGPGLPALPEDASPAEAPPEQEAAPQPASDDVETLRAENARLATALEAAGSPVPDVSLQTIRMKVEPPHSGMTFGGTYIGSEFTEVPASQQAALYEAAAGAGVTLTMES